ncbi:unnamed protein product [Echinostoma caproni]|uniref:K Homology domain-containing protein n=1 Tax=Echinostoma caproni TaxID=27848 RepID=A0A3P8KSC7_9TREM|nr:unnamed protein product [Echinostoma caproni]
MVGACACASVVTGAHIQVAAQVLPNSSDRPITLSGSARSVALSINQLCQIFVRLCFQDIGKPYQPQPTYAVPPAARLLYRPDPALCDQLSCSSLPAVSPEPLVIPVSPDLLFSSPPLTPSSYLDYAAATFPIASPSTFLYSPESLLPIPLLVPTFIPTVNPAGSSSLTYSPLQLPCAGTLEPKSYPFPPTTSAFMSNLRGGVYSTTGALSPADSAHLPLTHPVVPRLEITAETRPTGLVPGTGLITTDQQRRPYEHLAERAPFIRELEQLMNCPTAINTSTISNPDQLQADVKAAVAADCTYQTLLTASQATPIITDTKTGLSMHHLLTSPGIRTPDPLLSIPCPKTPCIRNALQESQHKVEMFLPNDLIGCIIGRGGNKINEIRQTSQATIKISSGEEGMAERRITIIGTSAAIKTAQTLINSSIELHKNLLAMNMVMNCFHTGQGKSPGLRPGRVRGIPGRYQFRKPQGEENVVENRFESTLSYYPPSQTNIVVGTPALIGGTPVETHSAPAQLGMHRCSDSGTITRTPSFRGSRKNSSARITPFTATPFLSATQLEKVKRPSNAGFRSTEIDQEQTIELVRPIPCVDQQKWSGTLEANSVRVNSGFYSSFSNNSTGPGVGNCCD